jgi:uncharacterized protein (DUF3084 family)
MDEKLLKQIEQYLIDSGLYAEKLRKRMDEVKASTTEFNRELLNARRASAELNRDFNDLSSQFKNIIDDLRKWDSTSSRINSSYKKLGGIADKLKYDAQDISRLSKKDLESSKYNLNLLIFLKSFFNIIIVIDYTIKNINFCNNSSKYI